VNLPSSIKVGYRDFCVEEWAPSEAISSGRYGECDKANAVIRVTTIHGVDKAANTLIHEVLHACFDVAGIADEDAEERTVTHLANALTQVIRDNPDLVAYLTDALTPTP
jgi:cob(I)alamin adenosyltransferase